MGYLGMVIVALVVLLVSKILQICRIVFWWPYAVTKTFQQQGIAGPPYSFLSGSLDELKKLRKAALQTVLDTKSHDITQRTGPQYERWSLEYGQFIFLPVPAFLVLISCFHVMFIDRLGDQL